MHSDTIIAIATGPGQGAIGVIRLSGPKAISICDEFFFGRNLVKAEGNTVHYGKIKNEDDEILDECLATLFRAPRSYTKEDIVELSCHGSPFILSEIVQLFIRQGVRQAQPGEFTMRAFLNGQLDLAQAEAVSDLIASENKAAHSIAMQQMRGGFSDQIKDLREQLIHFASMIELELDFGEEDVEFANRNDLTELVGKIQRLVLELLHSFKLGNVIKNGVTTVIAGKPNAGKSTLLNALLNEERAIVSNIPGTTRDTIEEVLNVKGIPFRLVDTAGIREATDTIEAIGVTRTKEKIEQSSIVIYLIDTSNTSPNMLWQELSELNVHPDQLVVILNKMDLNPYTDIASYQKETLIKSDHIISASALNKMNVPYIKDKLYELVLADQSLQGQTVVSNHRHYDALFHTNEALDRVVIGINDGVSSDFIAMDIRSASHHLGEITGDISTDDLLEKIFSSFCIGK